MFTEGMSDLVNIFSYNLGDDTAGGLVQGTKKYLYTKVLCRITILSGEKQLKLFGFTGKEMWAVLLQYSPRVVDLGKYYLELHATSPVSVICQNTIYRVVKSKHQRDEYNIFHHTSLFIERDESAEE